MRHYNIRVYGNVQGVFFRLAAKTKADELGVVGFVRNEEGGSVHMEIEGDDSSSDEFLEWCHTGPSGAHIHEVDIKNGKLKNFNDFSIQ